MLDLFQATQQLGLSAMAVRLSWDELQQLKSPAIAWVKKNHFMVVERPVGEKVLVVDYPRPPRLYTKKEFIEIWSGEALIISRAKPVLARFEGPPRLQFDSLVHHFGEMNEADGITSCTFRFSNLGAERVHIEKVSASCGCTATLLSQEIVNPGDIGKITVRFNAQGRRGHQEHSVFVESNDPKNPRYILTITAFVQSDYEINPPRLYLGEIIPGCRIEKSLFFVSDPKGTCHITRLQSPLEEFHFTLEKLQIDSTVSFESTKRSEVKLSFLAPEKPGNFESKITVHTNSPRKPQIVIPVEGTIVGELACQPSKLFFGTLKPGQTAHRTLKIYSRQKRPFAIKSAQPLEFPLHIESLPPKSAAEHELTLLFTAPTDSSERVFKGHLEVRTDLEDQTLLVPLLAIVRSLKER